jgi:hypothetical protein
MTTLNWSPSLKSTSDLYQLHQKFENQAQRVHELIWNLVMLNTKLSKLTQYHV